ncbi:AraC family transcriptional regulator [Sphingobacterium sp.]|uniref:AraC family transcriptional regulator n=1 Tax=Sphingobacterium sp. TaxID=341027 RepID=UPI0031E0920B
MKPIYTKILEGFTIETFGTKEVVQPTFSTEFHFHKECQLTYIVQSEGKRIVGDSVDSFTSEELTFLGADLPHVWHNGKNYKDNFINSRSMALYLNIESLLVLFSELFPTQQLTDFFLRARRGMIFYGCTKLKLIALLKEIVRLDNSIKKVVKLLEILDLLSLTTEYRYLSSAGYINNYNKTDNDLLDKIFKYIFDNYSSEISLITAANMCNMSKHSFCRFFKRRTSKTFMEFVNEVRISESCKQIAIDKFQISNIAYACGFNSLSNFNRTFKTIKGLSPTEYRRKILM